MVVLETTDTIRIVTGSAVTSITAIASHVNKNGDVYTPGRSRATITTAATTPLVAAPSAGQTTVNGMMVTNNSASSSSQVTIQHYDGSTAMDLFGVTLLAGENIVLDSQGNWHHHDAQGAEYFYQPSVLPRLGATGILAESFDRRFATTNSTIGASGTLFLQSVYLYAGQTVTNITMFSATTAAATTTNLWFALYDINRNLLAQSAAQGAYTWAANTKKTLAMQTPYKVTQTGVYYIGVLQVATTIATLLGGAAKLNAVIAADAPILHGNSNTGLSALPNPATTAITAGTASLYAAVS